MSKKNTQTNIPGDSRRLNVWSCLEEKKSKWLKKMQEADSENIQQPLMHSAPLLWLEVVARQ